ncbi:MAG: hypothetical protein Q9159_001372 [Coniocarpon cinnabarinum]
MVKIQSRTVAETIPKKRKRSVANENVNENGDSDAASATTTVPTKTQDGGSKPRRTQGGSRPSLVRRDSSNFVESSSPWPDHFKTIEKTFRALNLTYTFCCTRKHFATTFENLKSTVETHIGRPLEIQDVAEIKALVPQRVLFAYVSESRLQINLLGREQGYGKLKIGDMPSFQGVSNEAGAGNDQEVLLFEFNDGDLKREVQHAKTGEPTRARQKLKHEELRMPVYSQKQMLTRIEKRNKNFTSAINAFLNQCAEDKIDPVLALSEAVSGYVPRPSDSRANTPQPERQATLPKEIPKERENISDIISQLKTLDWYSDQIVQDGHRVFDPQEPVYGDLDFQLSQNLVNALYNTRKIEKLYAHQAEAINNLHRGQNVIVSTSTSSGKSLIYQIPVLHQLEQDRNSRAMYIFPTKALAQDQRRSLKDMLRFMQDLEDIVVETYDGDTVKGDRNYIRDEARIIFTNPDMLHLNILPNEESWRSFLKNLKYVVMDELHVYNGLFGAHVAFIMRRLRRVCAAVGNRHVKFISCSATVANPEEHMKTVFGVENVALTGFDGSPSGRKEFLCWNTPFKDPGDPTSGRGDTMSEAAKLFCQLTLRGVRVITFCRIRKQCEIMLNCVKQEFEFLERPEVMNRVMSYRGGYNPQDRRKIEKEMFEGKLVGIVATNALELGIDIGSLDAVITVGFPYTIANLRQQSGRAGRRNRDSLSVLVGDCFPTDQYYMDNPDEIFTKPNCELQVDLHNLLVVEGHIQCAAHEMPINPTEDITFFGKTLPEVCTERMVGPDGLGYYHCAERFRPQPSRHVAIRDTENDHFAIIDATHGQNTVLEELEASRAFFTIYEGGIFLHQGNTYLVREFSQERMLATVERVHVDWMTQQRDYTDIDPVETEAIRRIPAPSLSRAFFGAIRVIQVVFGFFKIDKRRRILDAVEVDNPPITIFSKGMWLDVPRRALEILDSRRLNVAAGIHAAEHAILSLMPNYVISMPGDVRTECKVAIKEFAKKPSKRKRPARLTFYDAKGGAGGSGISTKAFEFVDLLLRQACERVGSCRCAEGCLECCCSERCREANQVMSKAGGEVILRSLLGLEIDVDSLPWGEDDPVGPAGIETVIVASEVRPARGKRVEVVEVKREGGGKVKKKVAVGEEKGEDVERDRGEGQEEENMDPDCVVIKEEPMD